MSDKIKKFADLIAWQKARKLTSENLSSYSFNSLMERVEEVGRIIGGLRSSVDRRRLASLKQTRS